MRLNEKDNFLPKQTNKQFVLRLTYVVYFLREIASHLIEKFFGEKSHLFFFRSDVSFLIFRKTTQTKTNFQFRFIKGNQHNNCKNFLNLQEDTDCNNFSQKFFFRKNLSKSKAQATLTGYAGYPALDCPQHSVASQLLFLTKSKGFNEFAVKENMDAFDRHVTFQMFV